MSNTVFVVKNQQGLYLTKQQEWIDGADSHLLYRTRHRDEAINTVFEVSSRDIYLRAETVICELDPKGNPILATAEPVTPARAAQLARQYDLEDDTPPAEEAAADPVDADEAPTMANAEQEAEADAEAAQTSNESAGTQPDPNP
jgi:hypothetical protein